MAGPQQDYGWSFGRGTQLQQAGFRTSLEIGSADEGKDVVIVNTLMIKIVEKEFMTNWKTMNEKGAKQLAP